jgi:type II secretory pathway component PulL
MATLQPSKSPDAPSSAVNFGHSVQELPVFEHYRQRRELSTRSSDALRHHVVSSSERNVTSGLIIRVTVWSNQALLVGATSNQRKYYCADLHLRPISCFISAVLRSAVTRQSDTYNQNISLCAARSQSLACWTQLFRPNEHIPQHRAYPSSSGDWRHQGSYQHGATLMPNRLICSI